jgi:hypothetical protein
MDVPGTVFTESGQQIESYDDLRDGVKYAASSMPNHNLSFSIRASHSIKS